MNGLDVLLAVAAFGILLACERYATWRVNDRYRRLERRVHINLNRGMR